MKSLLVLLAAFAVRGLVPTPPGPPRCRRVARTKAAERDVDAAFAAQREMQAEPLDQLKLFRRSRNQLVGDHAFLSSAVLALVWHFGSLGAPFL